MMDEMRLDRWDSLSLAECELLAQRIGSNLPMGFSYLGLRRYQLGNPSRRVATYAFQNSSFVLIPGGSISLGYDPNREWQPNASEEESWRQTADEFEIEDSIGEFIAKQTTKPRQVEFQSMLVESMAGELGWYPISPDDPGVKQLVKEHLRGGIREVNSHVGGEQTRVRREEDGSMVAERADAHTHASLSEQLAETGFRFPTSDEWEFLCGGGSKTLFRWGDHVSCDQYPASVDPKEREWRRRWVQSGGSLEYGNRESTPKWNFHLRPNAFGLCIAWDPYKNELTSDLGITRGGDGGCSICGGTGFFVAWMTLATAYFDENTCTLPLGEPIMPDYTIGRRVLSLS